jgi:ectoine hydroxylase-related dioxygenase (phytanoyl-CoA dioxygenase family)
MAMEPDPVREITDAEVAVYRENGWAKLERLVDPALAADLIRAGEAFVEPEPDAVKLKIWLQARGFARRAIEPFRSVALSATMGRNVQRLLDLQRLTSRAVPVRVLDDLIVCKRREEAHTHVHQDHLGLSIDRPNFIGLWLALDEVTPEMGSMRFLSRAHREGLLGGGYGREGDVVDQYPGLLKLYDWSEPLYYAPGDATVHHPYAIHGAGANETDRPRWAYLVRYASADTLRLKADEIAPFDDEASPLLSPD